MSGMEKEPQAQPAPLFDPPTSSKTVDVHIINTTTKIVGRSEDLVEPVQKGHEYVNMPTFAFLIENKSLGKIILFDLGTRKDWWNSAPRTVKILLGSIPGLGVEKGMDEILQEGGVTLDQVSAVVWSHWHCDHTGNISRFPKTTQIFVGPGFKSNFMPGYPQNRNSPFMVSDFEGREVNEVNFEASFRIGPFRAFDFFGDGSFFILDVPGHAVGHVCGLARTTAETFVFMGGDVCHFGGMIRPSVYLPMPSYIPSNVLLDPRLPSPCPSSVFEQCHPDPPNARVSPFYRVTQDPDGFYVDSKMAQSSVDGVSQLDASDDVLICLAHDVGLIPVLPWFPHGTINAWKEQGWKDKCRWGFLNELPINGEPAHPWLVPGLMRDGVALTDKEIRELMTSTIEHMVS